MKRILLFVMAFCGLHSLVFGQVLENYDQKWRPYSEGNWWENNDQIQVRVNVRDFHASFLKFQVPAQSTLFVDGKLWQYYRSDTVGWVPLTDIRALTNGDSATFILINPNLNTSKVSIQKMVKTDPVSIPTGIQTEESSIISRNSRQSLKDYFVVALLINLLFFALYKLAYPYLLGVLVQPLSVINAEDFSDSGSLQKFFSPDILFYMLIVNMMLSQIGVTVIYTKSALVQNWISGEFWSFMLLWGLGIILGFVLSVMKFVGVRISGFFFDLGKNDFSHFFYLLRLVVFGASIILVALAFFMANRIWELEQVINLSISGFFWFYLFGVLGLFLIMMNRLSFKKYHLFTYLCIAELVPFLILSKWILVLVE